MSISTSYFKYQIINLKGKLTGVGLIIQMQSLKGKLTGVGLIIQTQSLKGKLTGVGLIIQTQSLKGKLTGVGLIIQTQSHIPCRKYCQWKSLFYYYFDIYRHRDRTQTDPIEIKNNPLLLFVYYRHRDRTQTDPIEIKNNPLLLFWYLQTSRPDPDWSYWDSDGSSRSDERTTA